MKVKYIGPLARGLMKLSKGGELSVKRGNVYDLPKETVKDLLATGFWVLEDVKKKEETKVEKKKEDVKN